MTISPTLARRLLFWGPVLLLAGVVEWCWLVWPQLPDALLTHPSNNGMYGWAFLSKHEFAFVLVGGIAWAAVMCIRFLRQPVSSRLQLHAFVVSGVALALWTAGPMNLPNDSVARRALSVAFVVAWIIGICVISQRVDSGAAERIETKR